MLLTFRYADKKEKNKTIGCDFDPTIDARELDFRS